MERKTRAIDGQYVPIQGIAFGELRRFRVVGLRMTALNLLPTLRRHFNAVTN